MKIRIDKPADNKNMTITIPTGFLFSRPGMYIFSRMIASSARKEFDKKVSELWKTGDVDSMVSPDDLQASEKLAPPITKEQARELLAALKDSRYLLGGLPLVSIEEKESVRLRIDL